MSHAGKVMGGGEWSCWSPSSRLGSELRAVGMGISPVLREPNGRDVRRPRIPREGSVDDQEGESTTLLSWPSSPAA